MNRRMPEAIASLSIVGLAGVVAAFFVGLTVVNVALGFGFERLVPSRRVMDLPLPAGQLRHELVGNVVFVAACVVAFTSALGARAVRFGDASFGRGAVTFVVLMLGFQVFYYGLHRAMHTRALLRFHRWHHESQVTTALSAQSVSPAEALGWMVGYVGLPLAISLVWPISFWGWAAYMAFNVSGNVVGHANVELSGSASGTRAMSAFANPWVYHALHHARWTGHYGFQAAAMDRIFGTEYADWPVLFRRVLAGQPMKSLKEKG